MPRRTASPPLRCAGRSCETTVEHKSEELAILLDRLAPQAPAAQAELGAKLAGIDNAAETHRRRADFLYGLYRLAGLDFHADRLRPK